MGKYEIIQKHHIARNEIIDKSKKTIDAVNEKHNKLKQRSRRDSLTMIELNNDLEGMRTKNDEYMLKIKRLDTEKANLTQNLSKIKSELKKYESDKMNYTKLQQKFDELLSDKKELSQKIENIKKNNLKERKTKIVPFETQKAKIIKDIEAQKNKDNGEKRTFCVFLSFKLF